MRIDGKTITLTRSELNELLDELEARCPQAVVEELQSDHDAWAPGCDCEEEIEGSQTKIDFIQQVGWFLE